MSTLRITIIVAKERVKAVITSIPVFQLITRNSRFDGRILVGSEGVVGGIGEVLVWGFSKSESAVAGPLRWCREMSELSPALCEGTRNSILLSG